MRFRFTQKVYDPETGEKFEVAPRSIEKSFVNVMAEGFVLCRVGGREVWRRRRARWKILKNGLNHGLSRRKKRPKGSHGNSRRKQKAREART